MAIGLQNMTNIDTSNPTSYPDGCIKDDPSGITGTPIEKDTVNDMYMFFDKMMRMMGKTPSGQLDNEVNFYQSVETVVAAMAANAGPMFQQFLGANYDPTKVYVLSGAATRTSNGIIFYNGSLYYLVGNSSIPCGGGTTDVIKPSTTVVGGQTVQSCTNGLLAARVVCAASGSGWSDFSAVERNITTGGWKPVTAFGAGFASVGAGVSPRYLRTNNGQIFLNGSLKNISGSPITGGTMFRLPSGYRPGRQMAYASSADAILVNTDGTVVFTGTVGTGPGDSVSLDSCIPFFNF